MRAIFKCAGVLPAGLLLAAQTAAAGELRVTVDATAGVRNDGNYYQVDPDAPIDPETGEPVPADELEAEIASAGLNFALSYALRTLELALAYSPNWQQNLDQSDLRATSHRLDFGLTGRISRRSSLDLRERLLYSPELDLTPSFLSDAQGIARRSDQLRHQLDVTLSTDLSRRWSFYVGGAHGYRDFDDPALVDTWTAQARAGTGYAISDDSRIGFSLGALRYDYEGRTDDAATAGVEFDTGFGRSSRFGISVGGFLVERSRDDALPPPPEPPPGGEPPAGPPVDEPGPEDEGSVTGWSGGLRLSGAIGPEERLGWSTAYRHSLAAGYGFGQTVVSDSVSAGLSVPAGRRLHFGLTGSAARNQELEGEDEISRFAAGTLSAGWVVTDWLRINGSYSRIWQRSEVAAFGDLSYARYSLGVAVRLYSSGETPVEPGRQGQEPRDIRGEGEDEEREPDVP